MTFFHQLVYFREGAEQMALDRVAQCDTHLTVGLFRNYYTTQNIA